MTQESVRQEILAHIANPWFAIKLNRACEYWVHFANGHTETLLDPHYYQTLTREELQRWMSLAAKTTYPGGIPLGILEVVAP